MTLPNPRLIAVLLLLAPPAFATAAPDADPVLARFDGGEVRASDVEREIRFLPRDERRYREAEGMDAERNQLDWIRRLALRQIALRIAAVEELDADPRLREEGRRGAREWWLERWRRECYGLPSEIPSDRELEEELRAEGLRTPARLRLSHIFLRAETPEEERRAIDRLERWRGEIDGLEEFRSYARRHSDSQSARKNGRLGYLRKGWLPAAVEEVLYDLPGGTISPPLPLRGGVHLFFVEKNEPARPWPIDQRLARRRSEVRNAAWDACRATRLARAELPASTSGDGHWPDLQVGEHRIPGGVAEELYADPERSPEEVRRELVEDEILFQTALAEGALEPAEHRRLEELAADVYLREILDRRRPVPPEPPAAELRALYEAAPEHFKTRPRLDLRVVRARVPEGVDPLAFLEALEELSEGLRRGEIDWRSAAADPPPGAVFEDWPLLDQLAVASRTSPFLLGQIATLPAGTVTEPIQDGADFYVVGIEESLPVRQQSFEEASPRLRRQWHRERAAEESTGLIEELLSGHDFRLTAEGRRRTGAAGGEPSEGGR